jgi:hypothetical protein
MIIGDGCFISQSHSAQFAEIAPMENCQSTPFLVAASKTTLTLKANSNLKIIDGSSHWVYKSGSADITLTVADLLDTGVMEAGKDYYVYLCADSTFKVSLNSTYPVGYTANNSRKIGGFHTLCANVGTIASHTLTGYTAGAILPASVWDLMHRPLCNPEGMAWSNLAKIWVDIYLQSGTDSATLSVNGGTITDIRVWNDHVDDFAAVGKKLLTDSQFQIIAEGSNQKTSVVGSVDPVTTGGHSDTAGRRMISNIGCEDCCGTMWQWLQDQSYRFDIGTPTYSAAAQTVTIYHAAAPGGNPLYVKFGLDGTPYLCCNMATDAVDKIITFGTAYKLFIKHDAAASGGLPLYFDYDAALPFRFLFNNTIFGKDCYAFSNDPNFMLFLKHDASAATNGVAVTYDDATDERLEYISPGSVNATMDLCNCGPAWAYQDVGSNKGSIYKQGTYGQAQLLAGGAWAYESHCGSRGRRAYYYRWNANSIIGGRGCAEPA